MRTELNRTTTLRTNFSGGRRALVAFFEYAKPDGAALDALEIESITNAANNAARELGADGVWRANATNFDPIELAENEGLAARIDLTLTKISPDPDSDWDAEIAAPETSDSDAEASSSAEISEISNETEAAQ